jgi:hypothetical protein
MIQRRRQIVTDALEAQGTDAKLVVNDYWRAAVVAGAASASRPGRPRRCGSSEP